MVTTKPLGQRLDVGQGTNQLLCESYINIEPPMLKIIREVYEVSVSDFTVFDDKVLVKGTVETTFYYLHPHYKRGKSTKSSSSSSTSTGGTSTGGTGTGGTGTGGTGTGGTGTGGTGTGGTGTGGTGTGGTGTGAQTASKKPDEFKSLDSWGEVTDFYGGIVHFHQQVFDFNGSVDVPGVLPGDSIEITLAEVAEFEPFVPVVTKPDGLVSAGTQIFKIDLTVKATRN